MPFSQSLCRISVKERDLRPPVLPIYFAKLVESETVESKRGQRDIIDVGFIKDLEKLMTREGEKLCVVLPGCSFVAAPPVVLKNIAKNSCADRFGVGFDEEDCKKMYF